ncbi:Fatty-acid-binding protein 2 [Linum perenne]
MLKYHDFLVIVRSPEVLDGGPKNEGTKLHSFLDRGHNEIAYDGCSICSHPDLNGKKNAVELRTGIEFPMVLGDASIGGKKSNLAPEILVGTGSKTMEIFRLKSFKVYTFGFYVHRNSLCKKLGLKYASNQVCESDKWGNFYQDLLREDIGMTVRLVINYNGMRTNTVRDVFEKSLRARLQKTNPNTDYSCLKAFGSLFVKDIPLPAGTTVDIRRTADGCLITEIEGNHIGSVQSKELCRAFFDMYLGDVPVSKETKEDIGKNVASIIRKC